MDSITVSTVDKITTEQIKNIIPTIKTDKGKLIFKIIISILTTLANAYCIFAIFSKINYWLNETEFYGNNYECIFKKDNILYRILFELCIIIFYPLSIHTIIYSIKLDNPKLSSIMYYIGYSYIVICIFGLAGDHDYVKLLETIKENNCLQLFNDEKFLNLNHRQIFLILYIFMTILYVINCIIIDISKIKTKKPKVWEIIFTIVVYLAYISLVITSIFKKNIKWLITSCCVFAGTKFYPYYF